MQLVNTVVQWVMTHYLGIAVALLYIIKGLEKLFPNAKVLGQIDSDLSAIVPPQS